MSKVDPFKLQRGGRFSPGSRLRSRRKTSLTPDELSQWLEARSTEIVDRWALEVRARSHEVDGPLADLIPEFLSLLVSFLPPAMGPWKDHVKPLFQQSAELYGNLAAVRGLAAGEAVEEMQLLREVLIRFLHTDPPQAEDGRSEPPLGLRESLHLNRFVDDGVTFASVGHMDTLFFNLLHGTGVTSEPEGEVLEEIRSQVRTLASELEGVRPLEAAGKTSPAN